MAALPFFVLHSSFTSFPLHLAGFHRFRSFLCLSVTNMTHKTRPTMGMVVQIRLHLIPGLSSFPSGCVRSDEGGRGGGGGCNHSLFIFFMWLSFFLLRSYQRLSLMLFSSGERFVQQKKEFNTETPGVNNRFDLTDKLV